MSYTQQHSFTNAETLTHTLLNNEFSAIETAWTGLVETSGAQTIAGVKTFSSIPVLPASNPTALNQAMRAEAVANFMRGYKSGMGISYKDADEIYVAGGNIHIYDGSNDRILSISAQTALDIGSPAASTWYYIYVDTPATGWTLTSSEFSFSTSAPSYSHTLKGWYHPTTTDLRCIGAVLTDGSSNIRKFAIMNDWYWLEDAMTAELTATPLADETWTDIDLATSVPNFGAMQVVLSVTGAALHINFRPNGESYPITGAYSATDVSPDSVGTTIAFTDTSQIVEYWTNHGGAANGKVYCPGWFIPRAIGGM